MAARPPRLQPGQDVIIQWVDSGMGDQHAPRDPQKKMPIKRTHGRVSWVGRDKRIHRLRCKRGQRCICWAVQLIMCSAGKKDPGSDIAYIWMPAIVEVRVWK